MASTRRWASGRYCSISARQAVPAPGGRPSSDATVGSSSWCRAIAVPSSNGCAMIASGRTQRSPSASSSSSRIAGDATVIGLKPAQWSWTNPGRVAATLVDAPPGRGACSRTVTSNPARARWIAQTRPVEPAPTTITRRSRGSRRWRARISQCYPIWAAFHGRGSRPPPRDRARPARLGESDGATAGTPPAWERRGSMLSRNGSSPCRRSTARLESLARRSDA